jgi:hypothetical protein
VTGIELVIGYLIAYSWRKARKVGKRADLEVDQVLDAGMDRLHDLVAGKLAKDPSLAKLTEQAAAGTVSERTRQRVQLALEDAAETDPSFLAEITSLAEQLQAGEQNAGLALSGNQGVSILGGVQIQAQSGGQAAFQVGTMIIGNPPPDPLTPDRYTG